MSASTQTAPRQMSFGRFPAALAMLALVVILAVAVAIVALNGTKAAAPATSGAKGAPPPAFIDHGSRTEMHRPVPAVRPFGDTHNYGGWGGLPLAPALKGPVYLGDPKPYTTGAPNGVQSRAQ